MNELAGLSFFGIILAAAQIGCTPALAPMDPHRLIRTEDGFSQEGRRLDEKDMLDTLKQEEAAADYANRAETLGVAAQALAGVGGFLMGWPIGGALAGEDSPQWGMAYAGGGAVLASVPLLLLSQSSLKKAVRAHNAALEEPSASVPPASWRKPEPREPTGHGYAASPQVSFRWQF